ncbi:MAG: hybrid sensor histidine kinase/response regulator [Rubrivivax sp.]|nr:MAG: hybrid sensor histidine kinase/response regulator [Rubrivivax sp.]
MTSLATRRVPLRRRLSLLALGAIVPLAVMAGIGIHAMVTQQRQQAERASVDLARALGIAVAGELRLTISAMQTLATSAELGDEDIRAFDTLSRRVLRGRPEWLGILLARPDGSVVSATNAEPGQVTRTVEMASLAQLVRHPAPTVGYMARGPRGQWGVPVRVPVMRDGRLSFVLTAVMKPEAMLRLLQRQRVPDNWLVSVWDGHHARVARSRGHERYLGSGPSPSLRQMFDAQRPEGIGPTHTLEGEDVYTAYTRLPDFGWRVTVAVPEAVIEGGARQSLLAYGGGVLASLMIGLMAAFAIARRINEPMGELRNAARALGTSEAIDPPGGDIQEIHEVGQALAAAAAQRARGEAERERLLQAEREAHALAQAAMLQAQDANRAKDEFLAMLGHELRNPLSPIVAALHLMARQDPDRNAFERQIIERQVAHMTRLVDDLLDVSRITQGKIELRHERLDLRAVVERALEMTRPLYDSRTHPVTLQLPPRPVPVWGDWVRLSQVLGNLLSNAAKFTPADGQITLSLRQWGDTAELAVSDTGNGIAAELLPQVFDLFLQGPQALHRGTGGLGLGLAIVKTLVQLHGGTVSAASAGAGRGSTFTVTLPTVDAGPDDADSEQATPAASPRGSERLLLVDDNQDAAETLAAVLRDIGYQVRTAADARSAIALFDEYSPELAVLDIGLPGMNGYELAEALHQQAGPRTPPLVALTGYGSPADRAKAMAAGFQERLVKPVDLDELTDTIRRLLDDRVNGGAGRG